MERHLAPFLISVDFDVSAQPTSFKGAIFVSKVFISVIDRNHSEKLPTNFMTERTSQCVSSDAHARLLKAVAYIAHRHLGEAE